MTPLDSHITPAAPGARAPVDPAETSPYGSVVFAGGGCRCFWQVGFWSVVADEIGLAPRKLVGVSAGAAFAVTAAIGRIPEMLADFKERVDANPSNFVPRRERAPGERAFPHERIYGGLLRDHVGEAELAHLQHRQEFSALLAHPHRMLGAKRGLALSVVATVLNQRERLVHARWGRRFGFTPKLVSARECETPDQLIEVILQSSCVPPIMPYYRRGGRPVIDGGVIDNAPADLVKGNGPTLVLLSFPHRHSNRDEGAHRTYVQPSGETPISQWDYTSPERVQQTFDMGRADGERFLERWDEVQEGLA